MVDAIGSQEFEKRLVDLCVRGGSLPGFPRQLRDRHIVLKSVALTLKVGQLYSEQEINQKLQRWFGCVGRKVAIDHVTLRRQLVDDGYLDRSSDGAWYRLRIPPATQVSFQPDVEDVNVCELVRASEELIERKRREYQRRRPKANDERDTAAPSEGDSGGEQRR